jgi:hypothetical protein
MTRRPNRVNTSPSLRPIFVIISSVSTAGADDGPGTGCCWPLVDAGGARVTDGSN